MKLKSTLALLVFFLCIGFGYAQKVKIKKDIIYFDGVAVLKSGVNQTMYSIYDLNGDEIIFIRPNIKIQPTDFYYSSIKFLNQKINTKTTEDSYASISNKQSLVNIIKWLLREKALTSKGKINLEKLAVFHYKYHEDIPNKITFIQKTECDCDCKD